MEWRDKSTIHEFLTDRSIFLRPLINFFFGTFFHQVIDFNATLRIAKTQRKTHHEKY